MKFHIHFLHKRCVLCVLMALVPLTHFLEPFGIPHGFEVQLESWVASLIPASAD